MKARQKKAPFLFVVHCTYKIFKKEGQAGKVPVQTALGWTQLLQPSRLLKPV
jgi:hypothetical protein